MPIIGLDFSNLHLCDALDLAILIEQEAHDRYTEFADLLDQHRTPAAAAFFRTMAGYEAEHAARLSARRSSRFGTAPRTISPVQVFNVEAADYDAIRTFMGHRAALQVALAGEEKARDFFATALPHLRDQEVILLFTELYEEEIGHRRLVQEEIARLPPEPACRVDDPSDPPVSVD